jgi:hypothetical protein
MTTPFILTGANTLDDWIAYHSFVKKNESGILRDESKIPETVIHTRAVQQFRADCQINLGPRPEYLPLVAAEGADPPSAAQILEAKEGHLVDCKLYAVLESRKLTATKMAIDGINDLLSTVSEQVLARAKSRAGWDDDLQSNHLIMIWRHLCRSVDAERGARLIAGHVALENFINLKMVISKL